MSPDDPRHGTRKGYRAHWSQGERACDPCLLANRRYKKRIIFEQDRGLTRKRPVLGVQRRVRALQRLGWSMRTIAREAGWGQTETLVGAVRADPDSYVTIATFETVRAVYERLSMQIPPHSSGTVRARNYAARMGWPPPLAYDDIDDPGEQPEGWDYRGKDATRSEVDPVVVMRLLQGDRVPSTKAEREAAMAQWVRDGGTEAELCRWHGWKAGRYTAQLRVIQGGAA